jgi:hypothetical protein
MNRAKALPNTPAERLRTRIMFRGLDESTVAEARALGPEVAGAVVAALIDLGLRNPAHERTALRATHLARELGLNQAIPPLIRCIESLGEGEAPRHAAIVVLTRLGAPGIDALIAAFDASRDTPARARIADALSRVPAEDHRIRAALVGLLADAPANAAWCLAERGEWRAVPDLIAAFDRLAEHPIGDCDGCALEHLSAIACAVRVLGRPLSFERQAKIDALTERAESTWVPFDDPAARGAAPRTPVIRGPRTGRNDPCPCGSGKKYKHCCLDADRRDQQH